MPHDDDAELRGRVRRLLEFLRELVGSQDKPVRVYGPEARVEWLHEPNRLLEINTDASAGEVVVRISRVGVEERPAVPQTLTTWIDTTDPDNPKMRAGTPRDKRTQCTYWLDLWQSWKKADLRTRPAAELFQSVDLMRHDLANRPETVELVVASGFLATELAGTDIGVHLITHTASIERDDSTGDLLVRLTDGTAPRLEDLQILLGLSGFDRSESLTLQRRLAESAPSPVSPDVIPILTDWTAAALPRAVDVSANDTPPESAHSIALAPALVLRKRTAFAITGYYDAMITALDAGDPVPIGLAQLVESTAETSRLDWLSATATGEASAEPLYPLPVNSAQASILDKLANDTGVVVEGPPGTGKTHTIANLMSALMAQGKRILVTSEKSQALRVLRDKLPAELQDLCVSITDLAHGGSDELDRSVSKIAARKDQFDPHAADATIRDLTKQRDIAKNRQYKLIDQTSAARAGEVVWHAPALGYAGTLAAIIGILESRRQRLGWIPGPIDGAEPPCKTDEFSELVSLLDASGHHAADRTERELPGLDGVLPPPDDVRQLCRQANQPARQAIITDERDLKTISRQCRELSKTAATVESYGPEFIRLGNALLAGGLGHLWIRAQAVPDLLATAGEADDAVGQHSVSTTLIDRHALDTFDALVRHYDAHPTERRRRLRAPQQQRDVEHLDINPMVDGVPAATPSQVRLVAAHLRAHVALDDAAALLADIGISVPSTVAQRRRINEIENLWAKVRFAGKLILQRDAMLATIGDVPSPFISVSSLTDVAEFVRWVGDASTRSSPDAARSTLRELAGRLDAARTREVAPIAEALRAADIDQFSRAVDAYRTAQRERDEQQRSRALLTRLAAAAPSLATAVIEDDESDWAAAAADFADAWTWRWVMQWVTAQQVPMEPDRLNFELDADEQQLATLTAQLAAESAWRECLQRMTIREVQALHLYQENTSKAGVGKGKVAQRFRIAARSAMEEAQTAVPAWIMPLSQVLSSIPPQQNVFDVVIVDEASQADITSLFLLWLAPRVIVVGDDKQCAPDAINKFTLDSVFAKLDTYLYDVPMHVRNTLTPQSSLFSMLRNRFGHNVALREHYRSMPEIIEWSSRQFYASTPLVPVRQFGADRLPPLRTTHVEGAVTAGSSTTLTNEGEARALVDQLCACLADPNYDGMTVGVVVLQSAAQANLIRSLLFERVPAEQREARRLRVGVPPEFQGDERDVMFVSMVVAPGTTFRAFTTDKYKRRFNVAASRARNQLWLFHSVQSADLADTDLRRSLLTYVQTAPTIPVPPMPVDVTADVPHPSFPSLLDQRVFLALRDLGYHVNPRVRVNELTIDLVVTGVAAKVAVECDDDTFYDPSQATDTIRRELELRRCGWNFYRIPASDFALDADRVLKSLVELLDSVGILPDDVHVVVEGTASTPSWTPIALVVDDPTATDPDETDDAVDETPIPAVTLAAVPLPSVIEPPTVEAEVEQPVRTMSRDDLIVSIRYALQHNQFTVERTVDELGVTTEQIRDALADMRARDAARKVKPTRSVRPTPRAMPRKVAVALRPVAEKAIPTVLSAAVRAELAALPAASWATARELAMAAASPALPLTLDRCVAITGLSPARADQLLADLVVSRKLLERNRNGQQQWVRAEETI